MDRVEIKNLAIFAYHGLHPEEGKLGQRFFLDITAELDLQVAGEKDDYSQALCYDAVCALAQELAVSRRFKLIEALAWHLGEALLEAFAPLQRVTVTVRKPSAPVGAILDHVGVSITRERQDQAN